MIISIDLYLDTISRLNFMGFHGSRIGRETNFLPIPLLHKIGITFDSHHVSQDDVDPLGLQGQVFWVRWLPAIFLRWPVFPVLGMRRIRRLSRGETILDL